MIDWHSHILPGMDDGSRNVEESLSLIEELLRQNVTRVVATPHFYADDESVENFLQRRDESFSRLTEKMPERFPEIVLGAEVRYYPGISRMSDLHRLCIEGSKLLLLEMPFSEWTEYTVKELLELASSGYLTLVLAHIERYMTFQSPKIWDILRRNGIFMQVNASFFTRISSRHKALSYLKKASIHFVGSDCHNMTTRPPLIGKAFEIIQKKFGFEFVKQFNEYGYSMLVNLK